MANVVICYGILSSTVYAFVDMPWYHVTMSATMRDTSVFAAH